MGVGESTKGTMEEAEGSSAPEAEVKTPEDASKVSPKEEKVEEKPIYTQVQADQLIHSAKSEAGRLQKVAEDERDTAKSEAAKLKTELEDNTEDIKQLEAKLEDITSEDPKRFDVVKELKEARDLKRTLKTATDELATQQKDNEATVTTAKETMLEIAIWEVATEYKGGDPVRLKNLCTTLGVTDEAKLREVADNLWEKVEAKAAPAKKAEGEEDKEKLNLDSGESHGGKGELTDQEKLDNRFPTMKRK